jgi:TonB family protein
MSENKNKVYGIIATVVFHLLLLFLMFTMALRTSLPVPGEEGVEVNLGYSDQGFGGIQAAELPTGQRAAIIPSGSIKDEEIVTTNDEETPSLSKEEKNKQKANKITPAQQTIEKKQQEPVINPNALYTGKLNGQGTSTNQGIAGGIGDQGRPDGSVGSNSYTGTGGSGQGPGVYLSGRSKVFLYQPAYNSMEQGTVVVEITVDRQGNVIRATPGKKVPNTSIGTTTTDQELWKAAREAALKSKFSANPNADPEQKGYIVYHFVKLEG